MIYNFQLHRITLILIVALLGVGGGLLFFSGLLVGISWQLPKPAADGPIAAAGGAAADAPEATRAVSLPPGFAQAAPAPTVTAPTVTGPAVTAPTVTGPTVTGPAVTAPAVSGPAVTGPGLSSAPLPLSPDAVRIPGRDLADPSGEPDGEPAAPRKPAPRADPLRGLRKEQPQDGFALQVGAFSQSENTQKLLQELAARGFEPYVVRTNTRSSRQVESVRIGHFTSRSEAAAASSELARAEGIRAFVVRASGVVP